MHNLCLPSGGCSHRCQQGHDCAGSLNASQFALGLRGLHTEDGGTWVTAGHRVLRLRPEPAAEPAAPRRLREISRHQRARRIGFALAAPGLFLILAAALRHCST